jgi:hypothetical protein
LCYLAARGRSRDGPRLKAGVTAGGVEVAGVALPLAGWITGTSPVVTAGVVRPTAYALVVTKHHELNAPPIIVVEQIVTINLML